MPTTELESARWVEGVNQAYANLFTNFVVHSNRVGFEDGLNFWGGATIFDPAGQDSGARALTLKRRWCTASWILANLRRVRARLPLLRDERTSLVQTELTRILSK